MRRRYRKTLPVTRLTKAFKLNPAASSHQKYKGLALHFQKIELQPGDILIQLVGQPVGDLASYAAILRTLKASKKVELVFRRDGEIGLVMVELIER
ncbi:MAG: hypothetical protein IPI17_08030 [Nitrosomonas sp.]|jgi:type II secretory pathway component PulC|nr:hypothetical protein [Nitrosomonas sp.]